MTTRCRISVWHNIEGMRERTVVVNSLSKTYSVTGWRVGYCIAPPDMTSAIRKVHDFLTVGAANPLQHAGAYALSLPSSYYDELQREYQKKRDMIVPVLQEAGFKCELSRRRVLCDGRYFGFRIPERRRVYETSDPRDRRRCRPWSARFIMIRNLARKWSDFAFVKRMKRSMQPPNDSRNWPQDESEAAVMCLPPTWTHDQYSSPRMWLRKPTFFPLNATNLS